MFGVVSHLALNAAAITLLAVRGVTGAVHIVTEAASEVVTGAPAAPSSLTTHRPLSRKAAGSEYSQLTLDCLRVEQRAIDKPTNHSSDESSTTHSPASSASGPKDGPSYRYPETSSSAQDRRQRTSDEEAASEAYDSFDMSFREDLFTSPKRAPALFTHTPLSLSRRRHSLPSDRGSSQRSLRRRPRFHLGTVQRHRVHVPPPSPVTTVQVMPAGDLDDWAMMDAASSALFTYQPRDMTASGSNTRAVDDEDPSSSSPELPQDGSPPFQFENTSEWDQSTDEDEACAASESLVTPALSDAPTLPHAVEPTTDEHRQTVKRCSREDLAKVTAVSPEYTTTAMLTDIELHEQAEIFQRQRDEYWRKSLRQTKSGGQIPPTVPPIEQTLEEKEAELLAELRELEQRTRRIHNHDKDGAGSCSSETSSGTELEDVDESVPVLTDQSDLLHELVGQDRSTEKTEPVERDEPVELALSKIDYESAESGSRREEEQHAITHETVPDHLRPYILDPDPWHGCACITDPVSFRLIERYCPTHVGQYPFQGLNMKIVFAAFQATIDQVLFEDDKFNDYLKRSKLDFVLRRSQTGQVWLLTTVNAVPGFRVQPLPVPLEFYLPGRSFRERATLLSRAMTHAAQLDSERQCPALERIHLQRTGEGSEIDLIDRERVASWQVAYERMRAIVRGTSAVIHHPGDCHSTTETASAADAATNSRAAWYDPALSMTPVIPVAAIPEPAVSALLSAGPNAASIPLPDSPVSLKPLTKSQKRNAARRAKTKSLSRLVDQADETLTQTSVDLTDRPASDLVTEASSPERHPAVEEPVKAAGLKDHSQHVEMERTQRSKGCRR